MIGTAQIEGDYRYLLTRRWADGGRVLVIIMLNPSTADAEKPDPTLQRCTHFAKAWGFSALIVVNPFALRSPTPSALLEASDPIGPRCNHFINEALNQGDMYLCAWGNPPSTCPAIVGRINEVAHGVAAWARKRGVPMVCLGKTQGGHPKHPLARGVHRVPDDQQPITYEAT